MSLVSTHMETSKELCVLTESTPRDIMGHLEGLMSSVSGHPGNFYVPTFKLGPA